MEKEFKTELEEAPYIAHMQSVLPFSFLFPSEPTKILDHLYLGSEQDATNLKLLKELGITHIVNCASVYCQTGPSLYGSSVKYLAFEAEDDSDYDIMQHFPQVFSFIEDARKKGGKVLIHCVVGINRSGALAVAYLMVHQKIGPISAACDIRKLRSNLLTNDGFQRQLISFARKQNLLHLDADKLNKTKR
ncbi:hypothetical protein LSH36_860g00004 [Paralvinella palmiformis]|uniref:protein-tyrosine-phosphatase n=1 Tax=Paralvinella palmiformis TaxID=53620 RepID=A0AAD9MRZ0_9ANNE|nr:hypothetical protein LSH36_860g00004 [Paralvinella palmiformis]